MESIVTQRPGDGDVDRGSPWCRCTGKDQTSMVVWLTGIQYLHVVVAQRSLTIVRLSRAFHGGMYEYGVKVRDSFDSTGQRDVY